MTTKKERWSNRSIHITGAQSCSEIKTHFIFNIICVFIVSLAACIFSIYFRGWTDSLYLRLRRRNRCNHRDLQNISQNGMLSFFNFFFSALLVWYLMLHQLTSFRDKEKPPSDCMSFSWENREQHLFNSVSFLLAQSREVCGLISSIHAQRIFTGLKTSVLHCNSVGLVSFFGHSQKGDTQVNQNWDKI